MKFYVLVVCKKCMRINVIEYYLASLTFKKMLSVKNIKNNIEKTKLWLFILIKKKTLFKVIDFLSLFTSRQLAD